jgi:hypothetical protein
MKPSVADWTDSQELTPPGRFRFERIRQLSAECAQVLETVHSTLISGGNLAPSTKRRRQ